VHDTLILMLYIDVHMKMGMCTSKVGWLAHPVSGHGKKSDYATGWRCLDNPFQQTVANILLVLFL